MTTKAISIIELSPNEISDVSGGVLPLPIVIASGTIGVFLSGVLFPNGALIAMEIFSLQFLGSYFICGNDFYKSIRKAINTELIAIPVALGVKLQQQPVRIHNQ